MKKISNYQQGYMKEYMNYPKKYLAMLLAEKEISKKMWQGEDLNILTMPTGKTIIFELFNPPEN